STCSTRAARSAWPSGSASSGACGSWRVAARRRTSPSGSASASRCCAGRAPRVPELLFEVGCEEIPAGYLAQALPELERLARQELGGAKLLEEPAPLAALGTPRRLALVAREVRSRQPDLDETLVGPPVSAGGKAKDGFARKYGLSGGDIAEQDT